VPTASHGNLLQNPWQRTSESQSSTFQWLRICVRARVLWYSDSFALGLYLDSRISSARWLKMQWSRVAAVAARRCLSLPRRPPLPRPPPVVSGPSMLVPGLRPRAHPVHGCPRRGLLALGRREGLCGPSLSRGPCVLLFSPPTPFRIHYTQRAAVFAVHHIFFKVTAPAPALAAPSPSASSLRLECSSQGAGRLVRVCCCAAGCFNQPRWGICFRSPGKAVQ
jgi:hypothetical protein